MVAGITSVILSAALLVHGAAPADPVLVIGRFESVQHLLKEGATMAAWATTANSRGFVEVSLDGERALIDPDYLDSYWMASEELLDSLKGVDPKQGVWVSSLTERERQALQTVLSGSEYGPVLRSRVHLDRDPIIQIRPTVHIQVRVGQETKHVTLGRRFDYTAPPRSSGGTVLRGASADKSPELDPGVHWIYRYAEGTDAPARLRLMDKLNQVLQKRDRANADRFAQGRSAAQEAAMKLDEEYFGGWDGRREIGYADLTPSMREDIARITGWNETGLMQSSIRPTNRVLNLSFRMRNGSGWDIVSISWNVKPAANSRL